MPVGQAVAIAPAVPILGLVFADSIDAKGLPMNPRFTYSPDAPQITLGVQIGQLTTDPGDLVVAWSQETDTGSSPLFTVHIAVRSGDVAFSTAKSQGSLAEGTYLVAVSLDGQSQHSQVDVDAGATAFTASRTVAAQPGGPGQPPTQGPTGIAFENALNPGMALPSDPPGCVRRFSPLLLAATVANTVEVGLDDGCVVGGEFENFSPTPITVQLRASIHGSGQVFQGIVSGAVWGEIDPCGLGAMASDLPGTQVLVETRWLDGDYWRLGPSRTVTLGEDTMAPQLQVTSQPAAGTTVKPGDTIAIDATATELRSDGPWQTGVQSLQITADPGGEVGTPWQNPSNLPQPCDAKTWSHELRGTYTVPANPGNLIKICVVTQDYANPRTLCRSFPTNTVTIMGTIEQKQDVTTLVPDDGGHIHDVIDELATFTVVSTDGKTLTGTEVTRFFGNHDIVEPKYLPVCHNESDASGTLSWTAQLTGTISRGSDGSLTIAAQGTPQQGPGYPMGACAGNGTAHLYLLPVVGRLINGKLDLHVDYPLEADQSGYETLDLHMNLVPNQAAGG